MEENFLKELRGHCKWLSEDFFLLGETLHGDYNKWMNDQMLDSVTNYECIKIERKRGAVTIYHRYESFTLGRTRKGVLTVCELYLLVVALTIING